MDPINRKHVWTMIQRLKRGRVVVLTTHSMEEAEALGDTIGIMGNGRLLAVGTSLSLRAAHGSGYEIRLVLPAAHTERVKALVAELAPSAHLVADAAGALSYALPHAAALEAGSLFKWIEDQLPPAPLRPSPEQEERLPSLLTDWSFGHTTLEG